MITITISPVPGRYPGIPVAFAGRERECGSFLDITARHVVDAKIMVQMNIDANPIPHARLAAYCKFAIAMEKLDRHMDPEFDYCDLLEYTSPTGESLP